MKYWLSLLSSTQLSLCLALAWHVVSIDAQGCWPLWNTIEIEVLSGIINPPLRA